MAPLITSTTYSPELNLLLSRHTLFRECDAFCGGQERRTNDCCYVLVKALVAYTEQQKNTQQTRKGERKRAETLSGGGGEVATTRKWRKQTKRKAYRLHDVEEDRGRERQAVTCVSSSFVLLALFIWRIPINTSKFLFFNNVSKFEKFSKISLHVRNNFNLII